MNIVMLTTRETGIQGEETAARYLSGNHYDIRERNVRFGRYEIDIIAYDRIEKMIVFVEVKARTHHSLTFPIHKSVDYRKRRAMRRAVGHWIFEHNYDGVCRIDVLSVCNGKIVEHIKDLGSDFI